MAISESARDFWDRISPRERRLVVFAAIAAPLTIAVWLGLAIHDGLDNMAAQNQKTRKALAVLDDLKARGPQQPADDLVSGIPLEALSLETYLNNAAKAAGFELKGSINPLPGVTRNGFVTTSVSAQVSDVTLDQLTKFLHELETKSKYVMVTHLDISRRDYKGKDKLEAQIHVSTYSREHEKKPEAGSDAGSDKKGG